MENSTIVKKQAIKSTIWKFLERILAQGVSFIVSLVIARILSPSDYSSVSIVIIFFTFSNVIISGGLNTALIQKKDADEQDYTSVLFFSVCISIVVYTALFFSAPLISELYSNNDLILMIRVMGLVLPINAVKSVWCAYISAHLDFKKFFFATLGGTIASGFVGIYMAKAGFGSWALIAQQFTNATIDTIILVIFTRINLSKRVSFRRFKSLFKYSWKILVASIIGCVYSESSPLIIGLKYTTTDLSYYTKGKEFPNLLSVSITQTLSAVLFPVLSKVQDSRDKLLQYTRQFIRVCSFLVFPALLGFCAISDNFVYVFLTSKWNEAVYYIKIFCICSMFDVVAMGNCEAIKASGRSDVYLVIEIIKKSLYFATIFIFTFTSANPRIFAISAVVCTIIQVLCNMIPNIKLINYGIFHQLADLLPNLIAAIVMMVFVRLIGLISMNKILLLLLQIVLGIIIYLTLSVLTHNKSFYYLKSLLAQFWRKKNAK